MEPRYNIYPSLLDKFQDLLDYEMVAEEPWNRNGEDYRLTPDEMRDKIEAELLDAVNRVPKGAMEAADKGTAFNEIVDCLIERRTSSRDDCDIRVVTEGKDAAPRIRAEINGFTFDYDIALCQKVAHALVGSLPQYKAEGYMQTSRGPVHLYGYMDEWVGNHIIDLKTTSKYSFGKFERKWQRHLYPWCVVESGVATEVESFTYLVVEWAYQRKGAPLTAKGIYEETYTYDHEQSGRKLLEMLELFIDWLEANRDRITDRKIFNEQENGI